MIIAATALGPSFWQATTAKHSLEQTHYAFHEDKRPWLSIDIDYPDFVSGKPIKVRGTVKNTGHYPAKDVSAKVFPYGFLDDVPLSVVKGRMEGYVKATEGMPSPNGYSVFEPGEEEDLFGDIGAMTEEQAENFRTGKARLYILVVAEYTDDLPDHDKTKTHHTSVCLVTGMPGFIESKSVSKCGFGEFMD